MMESNGSVHFYLILWEESPVSVLYNGQGFLLFFFFVLLTTLYVLYL